MSNRAWVTLATNDSYGLGALVLAHSLRRVGSAFPAVVLITPSVTEVMRDRLSAVFSEVITVDVLDSGDAAHLALLQRPELGITFTKIHCWNLTQYDKCVFLDADALVVQNCDELFEREELSAAPDVGWPDCFNSGVFVYTPSAETFSRLIQFAQERGSFDGGDQGLLNSFFSDWAHGDINKHLPFLYNVTSAAFYSYMPALKQYGQNLKIIHFIGAAKPWLQRFNWDSSVVDAPEHLRQFLQLWWDLFVADVHGQLDVAMVESETTCQETTIENPPEILPPQDVSQYFHYQPVLDPDSEFPWHRPDTQIEKEQEQQVDMAEIFDPWDNYGGHIPPKPQDTSSSCSEGKFKEYQDIRRYVWEYHSHTHSPYKESHENNHNPNQIQQMEHRHNNCSQHSVEPEYIHVYNQTTSSQHHTQPEVQYNHEKYFHNHHFHQEEPKEQVLNYHEQSPIQYHWQKKYMYRSDIQQDYPQHQLTTYVHSVHTENSLHTEHSVHTEHYNNTEHSPNHNHCEFQTNYEQIHENTFPNQSQTHSESVYNDYFDNSLTKNIYAQHYEPNYNINIETQKHTEEIHKTVNYQPNYFESQTFTFPKEQQAQVNYVNIECDKNKHHRHRKAKSVTNELTSKENINGDVSDSENELEDIIIPRHPYDGFYLRHRATIDSRGRKICTHEIPLIPSTSSSESGEAHDYFSAEEGLINDFDDQSGVAGNLARVALGSSQRETIDDLTRRQGWEAGNIDYMGVDSFDNIWAKISQTLSQARPSPPKQSPPRESAPPQALTEQVEVQTGEIAKEQVIEPVEVAKEVVLVQEVPFQEPDVTRPVDSVKSAGVPIQETVQIEPDVQNKTIISPEVAPVIETTPIIEPASTPVAIDVVSEKSVEMEPAKPVAEPITAPEPPVVTEEPVITKTIISVVKQSPISEAPEPEATPKTIEAPAPKIPTTVKVVAKVPSVDIPQAEPVPEVIEKTKTPVIEPVAVPVKVPSSDAAPQAKLVTSEAVEKIEVSVKSLSSEPVAVPVKVPITESVPAVVPSVKTAPVKEVLETSKDEDSVLVETDVSCPLGSTPEKSTTSESVSDSPPLANTPSKEEIPDISAVKSTERRKPAGKLQLSPPVAPDPLPTPDSEIEDAAALAQSIIASELRTPTVTSPGSASSPTSPPAPLQHSRLSVDEPEVPTPPVGAASLAQIGVKPKGKTTTAAQIESSVTEKTEPASLGIPKSQIEPTIEKTEAARPAEVPKKKVVKKVVKKASATAGDAPVPPPRKKEKKPKE